MAGTFKHKATAKEVRKMKQKGFDHDFEIKSKGILEIVGEDQGYLPSEVKVRDLSTYSGNGENCEKIIYGIETSNGIKGTLVYHEGDMEARRVLNFMANVKITNTKKIIRKEK
ncbi:hypothetical protein ACFSKL_15900 [Belliella marina]|uniref:Uncharacterized protein n=1 Tax=Belliella marina TaxID=1644146 RepID=A0ABW4VNF7_9BACT